MPDPITPSEALALLQSKAFELGFDRIGILDVTQPHEALEQAGEHLQNWLENDFQGSMDYMGQHGEKRWRPAQLVPGTTRVIALRLHYFQPDSLAALQDNTRAYISRYALGRDYHKTFRQRLNQLNSWIETSLKPQMQFIPVSYSSSSDAADTEFQPRAFVDSAPVMEKATAEAAGLGWIGKNTLVIDRKIGSYFFLGEIYTNIPLPETLSEDACQHNKNHCGKCSRCMEVCPTQAIVEPYRLDARRCISYLTIENKGPIPVEFREAIGNRVFGCDDCQIFCPWNRFAKPAVEDDFQPRHGLDQLSIIDGLSWSAKEFDQKTQGSPIRRTGYWGWLRNFAIAAGNHPRDPMIIQALQQQQCRLEEELRHIAHDLKQSRDIEMVLEHLLWALEKQLRIDSSTTDTPELKHH